MRSQIFVIAAVLIGTLLFSSKVRGLRNNNWLNIKHNPANHWQGMIGVDNKGFVKYKAPVYSLRSGFKILASYRARGLNTLWDIIHTFAPATENPTLPYINTVAQKTGIAPYSQLTDQQLPAVIQAMSLVEVGSEPPMNLVLQAQRMANL